MNLTKYLPFENCVLTTNISTFEILKRIADNIEPKQGFNLIPFDTRKYTKPYTGYIHGLTFTMNRNINYGNSFSPMITGKLETFSGKTEIKLKMRLVGFVAVLISLWLGAAGLVCLGIIIVGLSRLKQISQTGFSPMVLIPFVMFVFGVFLVLLPFKYESKKSILFLSSLLDCVENK
jgi:hypothetical protein